MAALGMAAALLVGLTACGGTAPTSTGGAGSTQAGTAGSAEAAGEQSYHLTNVSYDPTRELYAAYNEAFAAHYLAETGNTVEITQSHGGSGGQARSVVEGADADVVTLALAHDITLVEEAGLIQPGWLSEFERDSSPYTSTIVFLVRGGNPKNIHDWDDLTRDDVDVIHPDPKSSGAAMWNFLAAYHYADEKFAGDDAKIKEFLTKLYSRVLVMDSGARGATTTFVENGQGDVLVSWENEAIATVASYPDQYEIVSPSISILAQPSVAIVDGNADKNGTQQVAHDYLAYLYSEEGQQIIGQYGYRPSDDKVLAQYADKFDLNMKLCNINDFGGWDEAYKVYFSDGGVFDEIYLR
ncbi:MAG: sulfate ABC transporter substrate-binding protein [Butyrivibrio sp.]|nr:sulfate ABC transporter substrate-binding protein [Butyrivibrio sp.]